MEDPSLLTNSTSHLEGEDECYYIGTDFLEVKIYLIGVFASSLAIFSLFFNAFFTLVFLLNRELRRSPLYYFGILAVLDTVMALNYLALMAVPVYMDQFEWLWLYWTFLGYLRPMLTLSNCAMFASVLLILLATVERLLRTFHSEHLASFRRLLERNRPCICLCFIGVAFLYKLCTYFEIHYIEHQQCEEWTRFEIIATELAEDPNYRFWWMFVARNMIDRIIPFFVLVFFNFLIIRTLKREQLRHCASAGVEISLSIDTGKAFLRQQSLGAGGGEDQPSKKNLRDATRALLAIVAMYLMSQSLQVLTTIWEAFWRGTLESEYIQFYSYLNDVMSIMTLCSSALRFPVYFSISRPIRIASRNTLLRFYPIKRIFTKHQPPQPPPSTTMTTSLLQSPSSLVDAHPPITPPATTNDKKKVKGKRKGGLKRQEAAEAEVNGAPSRGLVRLAIPEDFGVGNEIE